MGNVTGVIGVSSPESARYSFFYSNLACVEKPQGTAMAHCTGACISQNRNSISAQALDEGAEWVWFVDDDHVFQPTTLTRLLARNVDVVSGIYLQRGVPFNPHMYDREEPNGAVYPAYLTTGKKGLQEVLCTGAGCLLVKAKVLAALELPFWRLGQINPAVWGDDIDFCRRVRAAGFKIHCDLDVPVGHFFHGVLYPHRDAAGEWTTVFTDSQGRGLTSWPQNVPE